MSQYAEIISDLDEPKVSSQFSVVESHFDNYFNKPSMTKIKDTYDEREKPVYSMYACKLYCLLNRECRYIIAITLYDTLPVGFQTRLSNLNWVSLQTRSLLDNYQIPTHSYEPTRNTPLNCKITRTKAFDSHSEYTCSLFPVKITLLHTETSKFYQTEGTIVAALETFQTIITKA